MNLGLPPVVDFGPPCLLADADRFHSDTVGEEHLRRKAQYERKVQINDNRRQVRQNCVEVSAVVRSQQTECVWRQRNTRQNWIFCDAAHQFCMH